MHDKIQTLRIVGNIEGWSYLILLFVAMPLKYLADIPMAVKIVGMAHGVLFIAFVAALILAATAHRWSYTFSAMAFVASLVPFGTFFLNKKLIRLQEKLCYN
jgi:integral membrane protein